MGNMQITYWVQKPNLQHPFGKHRWQEMGDAKRKAITFSPLTDTLSPLSPLSIYWHNNLK